MQRKRVKIALCKIAKVVHGVRRSGGRKRMEKRKNQTETTVMCVCVYVYENLSQNAHILDLRA